GDEGRKGNRQGRQGNAGRGVEPRRHGGHDERGVDFPLICLPFAPLRLCVRSLLRKTRLTQRREGAKEIGGNFLSLASLAVQLFRLTSCSSCLRGESTSSPRSQARAGKY